MRNLFRVLFILGLFCLASTSVKSEDKFELIKSNIKSAAVIRLDVEIMVESKVFEDIDTTIGRIILADDGRYRADLGNDIYLNDGKTYWEYSAENNQATKRDMREGEVIDNRLAFLKDIDSFYFTAVLKNNLIYRLTKIDSTDETLPDSMIIILEKKSPRFSKIEYYDLNDDLNSICISEEYYFDYIKNELFQFDLPDSAEIILLPNSK